MRKVLVGTLATLVATVGVATLSRASLGQSSAEEPSVPTWTRDVGPLLADSCMSCHRPGEVAPMSLLSYEEARPWAKSIRQVVRERIMPPWKADPRYGRFSNDRRLTGEQVRTIEEWVSGGAPRGEGDFTSPAFVEGWALSAELGPPDHIFEMEEPYRIPAGGPDQFPHITAPTNHAEDIWARAVEMRGNPRVVHHGSVSAVQPDGSPLYVGNIIPGLHPHILPQGSAKGIPAGSTLQFDMHYHPSGQEEFDRAEVGIWLAQYPITDVVRDGLVRDRQIEIPPYAPNYESVAEMEFDVDAELLSLEPHMHYRGKDMMYEVIYPDGREEILLSVPNYDFNWQLSYYLTEPVPLAKGTKLRVTAHFDNSENNPRNPNPSLKVVYGQDSRDEMMEGWFRYRVKRDEPIIPSHIPASESEGSSPRP